MNITKFGLEEFKTEAPKKLSDHKLNVLNVIADQAASQQEDVSTGNADLSAQVESSTSEEKIRQVFENVELEKQLLEDNKLIKETLDNVKNALIDIEKQQESQFVELSQNILIFIKNFVTKIISNPILSKLISDKMFSHIDEILDKVKNNSSLNVKIPSGLTENLKQSLLDTFKTTASKLNIEVTEHQDQNKNVSIEWEDGKAELDIENPLKDIEEELSKYDTRS